MLGFKKASTMFKTTAFMVALAFISALIGADMLRAKTSHAALLNLPEPGQILSLSKAYSMPQLRGLQFDPLNPLNVSFYIDPGSDTEVNQQEASKLVRYFLSALTIPEKDVWVNLSPYENDRVVEDNLGVTDMGRDLLAQDYVLKQLSASLTHPETSLGKDYWESTYETLLAETGSTSLPVNTFNKVWIMPKSAEVYEENGLALITESELTAMLEEDYLALNENVSEIQNNDYIEEDTIEDASSVSSRMMKEILLPKVIEDVNEGKNFANLRQIYNAQILAAWFKNKFSESFYANYINGKKTGGIDTIEDQEKQKIFDLYVEAFKKGAYNFVKKEYDASTNTKVKKRYFSGGYTGIVSDKLDTTNDKTACSSIGKLFKIDARMGAVVNGAAGLVKNTLKLAIAGVFALALQLGATELMDFNAAKQSVDAYFTYSAANADAETIESYGEMYGNDNYTPDSVQDSLITYIQDTYPGQAADTLIASINKHDSLSSTSELDTAEVVIDTAQSDTALVDSLANVLPNPSLVFSVTSPEQYTELMTQLRTRETALVDSIAALDANDPAAVALDSELRSVRRAIRIKSEIQTGGTLVGQEFRFGSNVLGSQNITSRVFADDFSGAEAVIQQMITGHTTEGNTEAVALLNRTLNLLRRTENARIRMQDMTITNRLERTDILTAHEMNMALEAIQEAGPDLYWGQVLNAVNVAQNDSAFVNSIENDSLKEMIITYTDSLTQLQADSATVAAGLHDVLLDSTHADSIPSWTLQYERALDSVAHYDTLIAQAEEMQGDSTQGQVYLDSMATLETDMKALMPDTTVFDETTIQSIIEAFEGGNTDEYVRITTAIREKGIADGLTNAQINANLVLFRDKILEYKTQKQAYDAIDTGSIDQEVAALRERRDYFANEVSRLYDLLFSDDSWQSLEFYQTTIPSVMIVIEELIAQAYGIDLEAKAEFEAQRTAQIEKLLNTNGIGNSAEAARLFRRAELDAAKDIADLRMEILSEAIAIANAANEQGGLIAKQIPSQTLYARALANTPQGLYTGAESSNFGFISPWGVLKLGDLGSQAGQFGVYGKFNIGTPENFHASQTVGVTLDGAAINADSTGAISIFSYDLGVALRNSLGGNQFYIPGQSTENHGYDKEISDYLGYEISANIAFDRMTAGGLRFGAATAFLSSHATELTEGVLDLRGTGLLASNTQLRFSPMTRTLQERLSGNSFARNYLQNLELLANFDIVSQSREWEASPLNYSDSVIATGADNVIFTNADISVKTRLLSFMMGANSDKEIGVGIPLGRANLVRFAYMWNDHHGVRNITNPSVTYQYTDDDVVFTTEAGATFGQDGFERMNWTANAAVDRWRAALGIQAGPNQTPIINANFTMKFGFARARDVADQNRRAVNYTSAVRSAVAANQANYEVLSQGDTLADTARAGTITDINGDEVAISVTQFNAALDSAKVMIRGDITNPKTIDIFMLTENGYAPIRGGSAQDLLNSRLENNFAIPVYENQFDPSDSLHIVVHAVDAANIATEIEGLRAEGREVFHIGGGRLVIARQDSTGTVTDEISVPASFKEQYLNDVFGAQAQSNGIAGAIWYLANNGRLMYETITEEELNLMKSRNEIRRSSLPGLDGRREVLATAPLVEGATPNEVVLNDVGIAAFAGISTDSIKANFASQVSEVVIDSTVNDTVQTDTLLNVIEDAVIIEETIDSAGTVIDSAEVVIDSSDTLSAEQLLANSISQMTYGEIVKRRADQTSAQLSERVRSVLEGVDSLSVTPNHMVKMTDHGNGIFSFKVDDSTTVVTLSENGKTVKAFATRMTFVGNSFRNSEGETIYKLGRTEDALTAEDVFAEVAELNASSAVGGIDFDNVRSLVKTKAGSSSIDFPKLNMAKLDGLTFLITNMQETTGAKVLAYAN